MKYRKIAQEVIQMALLDQKVRKAYEQQTCLKKMRETDRLNLRKMRKIVKQIGWPTISKVGKEASHFAWLLVQHADNNVEFQQYCLELMRKEAESGNVTKTDIAFLTDRILVNRGRTQIYGTQFYESKEKLIPRPIRNIDKLDERRKRMGLEPFEDYENKILSKRYPAESSI